MTWFCRLRRAFVSPRTGRIVLTEEQVLADVHGDGWSAEQGEISIWEGWR